MDYLSGDDEVYGGKKKGGDSKYYGDESSKKYFRMGCNILCLVLIIVIAWMLYKNLWCNRDGFDNEAGYPNPPYKSSVKWMSTPSALGMDGERHNYENTKMGTFGREGFNESRPTLGGQKNQQLADLLQSGQI